MIKLIIENDTVINRIVVDENEELNLPEGLTALDDIEGVNIGATLVDGEWINS